MSSIFSTRSIADANSEYAGVILASMKTLTLLTTASALSGSPLVKLIPLRTAIFIAVGLVSCQDSASQGSFLPVVGLFQTSGSTIAPPALRLSDAVVPFGQSVCGSKPWAIVRVFGACANAVETTAVNAA